MNFSTRSKNPHNVHVLSIVYAFVYTLITAINIVQLQAVTRKDSTPPAPLENEDADELAGEETQQVQLVVAEVESEGQKTPDNMESDAEQENVPEGI